MTALIGPSPEIDFVLTMDFDGKGFVMDTRQFREILGGISLSEPEVLTYIRDYLKENMAECDMNF